MQPTNFNAKPSVNKYRNTKRNILSPKTEKKSKVMVAMKAPYQCQNDHILDNSIEDYDLNCPFCTTIMHMKEVAVKKFKSKLDSYKFSKPRLPVAVQPTKSERVSKLQVKSTSQKMMKKE